ncbi:hypothetical protein GKIL_2067 [Gloeobacter kilaueensis JS1]|uniref:Uncharacterized protein n=1 Tax=Gloeobacter kilaueensis (strain ATCC BAA-2537 / CCAP 1431/1 / ULC 316 / JS1) TaxID=1183438 RepID=U5QHH4_GLOK1|nr:hypothetical protein GKIL_2067 [Gloeobacter kilaueensis JS1]
MVSGPISLTFCSFGQTAATHRIGKDSNDFIQEKLLVNTLNSVRTAFVFQAIASLYLLANLWILQSQAATVLFGALISGSLLFSVYALVQVQRHHGRQRKAAIERTSPSRDLLATH